MAFPLTWPAPSKRRFFFAIGELPLIQLRDDEADLARRAHASLAESGRTIIQLETDAHIAAKTAGTWLRTLCRSDKV